MERHCYKCGKQIFDPVLYQGKFWHGRCVEEAIQAPVQDAAAKDPGDGHRYGGRSPRPHAHLFPADQMRNVFP